MQLAALAVVAAGVGCLRGWVNQQIDYAEHMNNCEINYVLPESNAHRDRLRALPYAHQGNLEGDKSAQQDYKELSALLDKKAARYYYLESWENRFKFYGARALALVGSVVATYVAACEVNNYFASRGWCATDAILPGDFEKLLLLAGHCFGYFSQTSRVDLQPLVSYNGRQWRWFGIDNSYVRDRAACQDWQHIPGTVVRSPFKG